MVTRPRHNGRSPKNLKTAWNNCPLARLFLGMQANTYILLADLVVVLHLAYVLFVIFGLLAVFVGYLRKWNWVRNRWFRLVHLGMIAIVVVESLLSITCPLTTLESWLRVQGGQSVAQGSFVGRCVHAVLFYQLSPQFFTLAYCGFGALVLLALVLVPVRWSKPVETLETR